MSPKPEQMIKPCPDCSGTGKINKAKCKTCEGLKVVAATIVAQCCTCRKLFDISIDSPKYWRFKKGKVVACTDCWGAYLDREKVKDVWTRPSHPWRGRGSLGSHPGGFGPTDEQINERE